MKADDDYVRVLPPQALPLVVPPDSLPAPVHEHAAELSEWGQPEAAAGLCMRWAGSTAAGAEHPLYKAAALWWQEQDHDVQDEVEGLVVAGAVQLASELEALGIVTLPLEALEALAVRYNALASACTLLFSVGKQRALPAERRAGGLLAALMAAQKNDAPYTSPILDALARRDLGWWTVAPGAASPPLDPDTVPVLDQQELDLLDDLDADENFDTSV